MVGGREWCKLIENDAQLQITQQKISELHAILIEMKSRVPYAEYREMAEGFLADVRRMQEEIREYVLRAPTREQVVG